jgi:hypothetical protein
MKKVVYFKDAPEELKEEMTRIYKKFYPYSDFVTDPDSSFMFELGGNLFIIEKEEDIKEIQTVEGVDLRKVSGSLDTCRPIKNYWLLQLCTNDAGGNIYLVPNKLVNKYIEESKE